MVDFGYVARQYLNQVADITNCNETVTVTGSGVYLRNGPGTAGTTVVETLNKGQLVTRIEKGKYNLNGYVWDRVKLSNGKQGYMASTYLSLVNSGTTSPNNNFKYDDTSLVCEPATTVENIKAKNTDAVIRNAAGDVVTSGNIGTGYKITTGGKEYTVVKYGDATGDAQVNSFDYIRLMNYIMGKKQLSDAETKAADVNKDGTVNSFDYIRIMNYIMGTKTIEI